MSFFQELLMLAEVLLMSLECCLHYSTYSRIVVWDYKLVLLWMQSMVKHCFHGCGVNLRDGRTCTV